MGLVHITSWYPKFNGSHFGLPHSSIHRMTGLGGKMGWTMTYSHRPIRRLKHAQHLTLGVHKCSCYYVHVSVGIWVHRLITAIITSRKLYQIKFPISNYPFWCHVDFPPVRYFHFNPLVTKGVPMNANALGIKWRTVACQAISCGEICHA